MTDSTRHAVQLDGRIIGYVTEEWPRTRTDTWTRRWVIRDEEPPLDFDTYEEACAHLVTRYAKERAT